MVKTRIFALVLVALAVSASANYWPRLLRSYRAGTFYGNQKKLGGGHIRTFVTVGGAEKPVEVGIEADIGLFDLAKLPT